MPHSPWRDCTASLASSQSNTSNREVSQSVSANLGWHSFVTIFPPLVFILVLLVLHMFFTDFVTVGRDSTILQLSVTVEVDLGIVFNIYLPGSIIHWLFIFHHCLTKNMLISRFCIRRPVPGLKLTCRHDTSQYVYLNKMGESANGEGRSAV